MITVRNTNMAMRYVYDYIFTNGVIEHSRNGRVIRVPWPVTIQYTSPHEKVNFCPIRNANPFFHFIEPLWMLEGIGDVELITRYLPRMAEFSDNGDTFNAHYGVNARCKFGFDQLKVVIDNLRRYPESRREVVTLWDPQDLLATTKDKACNMQLLFNISRGELDMTVYNRSNDAIWGGVSGANITNLFVFQEYIAGMLEIPTGVQFVVSNNLHMYLDNPITRALKRTYSDANMSREYLHTSCKESYRLEVVPMVNDPECFDLELESFMGRLRSNPYPDANVKYRNVYFNDVAQPMMWAHHLYKKRDMVGAKNMTNRIQSDDWRIASNEWLTRIEEKRNESK